MDFKVVPRYSAVAYINDVYERARVSFIAPDCCPSSRLFASARTRASSWSRRNAETFWNTSSVAAHCRRTRHGPSSTAWCSPSSTCTITTLRTETSSVRTFCSTNSATLNSPTSALRASSSTRYALSMSRGNLKFLRTRRGTAVIYVFNLKVSIV